MPHESYQCRPFPIASAFANGPTVNRYIVSQGDRDLVDCPTLVSAVDTMFAFVMTDYKALSKQKMRAMPKNVIMLGSPDGPARMFAHVITLTELVTMLGGIQQMGVGPNPTSIEEQKAELQKYEEKARGFLRQLSLDLIGLQPTFKKE